MVDTILDDVKDLLRQKKGDPKLLDRIKRAAEQGEVISVYERNYVNSLVEQFLRPKYESEPEVAISQPSPSTQATIEPPPNKPQYITQSSSKKKKIFFGIGAVIIIALIAGGISLYEPSSTPNTITPPTSGLAVTSDVASYVTGDIISISGTSDSTADVQLAIVNAAGQTAWSETVPVKSGGTFSTLTIAGGNGWESSGSYTLSATQGSNQQQTSFNFQS